jgi:hypothetical protein
MPAPSRAYKKEGGAPTFRAQAIRIGSLEAPNSFVSECDLGGTNLKVTPSSLPEPSTSLPVEHFSVDYAGLKSCLDLNPHGLTSAHACA